MNIFDILQGTPYWVWVLFMYLLILGVAALTPRIVAVWRLVMMPLIFIVWSLIALYTKCKDCLHLSIFWLTALLVGCLLMYRFASKTTYGIDVQKRLVSLPGSIVPLSMSLIFFVSKYILNATYEVHPSMKARMLLMILDVTIAGLISGAALGRFLAIMRSYARELRR